MGGIVERGGAAMYRSMLDPYESTGLWRIAGTDVKPQLGVLRYDPGSGLRVDLDWLPHQDASDWIRASSERSVTIMGERSMGTPLVLEDCVVVPGKGIPGYGCLRVHASIAFLGLDVEDPSSVEYSTVSFTATELSSWCDDLSGFADSADCTGVAGDWWTETLRWKEPDRIDLALPGAVIHLGLSHTVSPGRRVATITERPGACIEFEEPQTRDSLMQEYVYPLCDLLTLATAAPCHLDSCALVRAAEDGGDDSSELDRRVEVLQVPASLERPARDRIAQEMLFTLADTKDVLADLVPRWLAMHSANRFAMALYFSTRQRSSFYVERRFLSIAQACEAFDQATGSTKRDAGETRGFKQRVLASASQLDDEDVARLEVALQHVGRVSFREHILTLMDDESVVTRMTGIHPESFAREVKETRNFWTHGSTDLRWAVKGTKELHALTEVLDYLFQDRLLRELGFGFDQRYDMFKRNFRFSESRFRWW